MGFGENLRQQLKEWEEEVEDARSTLLEYDEVTLLEALIRNTVIDPKTGKLTDYWMNLINTEVLEYEDVEDVHND